MTITANSRYFYSDIEYIQLEAEGDNKPIVFYEFGEIGKLAYKKHIYVQGERLDQLANHYYNKPSLWWYILEANPSIQDFQNLRPGTELIIPNV